MQDSSITAPPSIAARLRVALGGYNPVLRWYRQHRPRWVWLRFHAIGRATAKYVRDHGLVTRYGPFEGLQYPPEALGHVGFLSAKLLGQYEPEVQATLAKMDGFDVFADIGSGEGYFIVGMAKLFPDTRVIGFETTAGERRLAERMADLNGVRLEVRGTADHATLENLPAGRTLLLVDIEGYEVVLLDPQLVPRLKETTMVVELHYNEIAEVEDILRERFSGTHHIELLHGQPKEPTAIPELAGWSAAEADLATTEGRGMQGHWMVLEPK